METLVDRHHIERELRATRSAQREIGPNDDHQLIEAFMQQVSQQAIAPSANQAQLTPNTAFGLRLLLAILSLGLLIPLAAITTSTGGVATLVVVGLVMLGITIALNRHHEVLPKPAPQRALHERRTRLLRISLSASGVRRTTQQ